MGRKKIIKCGGGASSSALTRPPLHFIEPESHLSSRERNRIIDNNKKYLRKLLKDEKDKILNIINNADINGNRRNVAVYTTFNEFFRLRENLERDFVNQPQILYNLELANNYYTSNIVESFNNRILDNLGLVVVAEPVNDRNNPAVEVVNIPQEVPVDSVRPATATTDLEEAEQIDYTTGRRRGTGRKKVPYKHL